MTDSKPRLSLIAIVAIAAVCVAGLLARADGYGFSPPSGWRVQRAPAGYAGLWVNQSGREAVNLATIPAGSLNDLVSRQLQKARAAYPGMRLYSNVPYHVCGRHDARYLVWTSATHASQWIHEQVMADWQGSGFVASYVRPGTYPPSRGARASIVSVCGVPGGAINNPSAPQAAPPPPPQQNQPQTPANAAPATPTPYGYPSIVPRYAPVIPM